MNLLSGNGNQYWSALIITLVLTALALYLAQKILRIKDM